MKFFNRKIRFSFLCILLWFDVSISGIFIEPYLQNVTEDGITVLWWTDESHNQSQLEYGANFENTVQATMKFVPTVGKYLHTVTLAGLPGGIYRYRVKSGPFVSGEYQFRTAVERDSGFNFVILGDGRTDNNRIIKSHRAVTNLASAQNPEIAIHVGDMVRTGDQAHWERFWRRIATQSDSLDPGLPFASKIPYYLVVGNHEIYSTETGYDLGNLSTTMNRFKAYVSNPANGSANPDWEERYYSFQYGCATFIILDANNTDGDFFDNNRVLPDYSSPGWEPGSEQYLWLIDRLQEAQQTSVFTFVLMHPAPYSRAIHGKPGESLSGWNIRVLDPVFRHYGVDAVFSGHDHTVERCLTGPDGFENLKDDTSPQNLNYFVQGNSGQSARGAATGWETWMDIRANDFVPYFTRYFYDWDGTDHRSFLNVRLQNLGGGNWQATFETIRDDSLVFDAFAFERQDPVVSVPVEIVSFSATLKGDSIALSWMTSSESNNLGFEIQKSTDKQVFQKIGFLRGSGTTNLSHRYSFVYKPLEPGQFFFRLKQIDSNGKFRYSKIVEIGLSLNAPEDFSLHQNFPNPFLSNTMLSFLIPQEERVTLEIFSVNGRLVRTLVNDIVSAGTHHLFWNGRDDYGRDVSDGFYFCKLSVNHLATYRKILKIR